MSSKNYPVFLTKEVVGAYSLNFFRNFYNEMIKGLPEGWKVEYRVFDPSRKSEIDLTNIDSKTVLILWGDERSLIYPNEYVESAGVVLKPYCPESWVSKKLLPFSNEYLWDDDDDDSLFLDLKKCSERKINVLFSGNLNHRRIDLYRGLTKRSFCYPFKISACYPKNGIYPIWQKIEAKLIHSIIQKLALEFDLSNVFDNSYIQFYLGWAKGKQTWKEYWEKTVNSKIVISPPGFVTNETARLVEASRCGCVVVCGELPQHDFYKNAPFVIVKDWRKINDIIKKLLTDTEKMDELGKLSRNWYLEHLSPKALAKNVLAKMKDYN